MADGGFRGALQKHQDLKERTKQFALRVLRLCDALPSRRSCTAIAAQLIRSGTSVAANYRAAGRARSYAEFISKLGLVIEEADETVFCLEFLAASAIVAMSRLEPLLDEARELVAIFAASRRTARSRGR
jgi:four helix bundle protein